MKPSLAKPGKTSRSGARNATLMNLFGTPGLGSLMARRWVAGTGQLALFLTGFVFFCVWVFPTIASYYSLPFSDEPAPPVPGANRALVGGVLCIISWFWSLGTSISLMNAAKKVRVDSMKAFGAGQVRLDESKLPPVLAEFSAWQREGEVISRVFEFKDFPAAMAFVNDVAKVAEQVQHHPDIDIRWNKVRLALTTHEAGGLTEKDFAMARECDVLADR